MKKLFKLSIFLLFVILACGTVIAAEQIISGSIETVAEDGSYIIVDGKTITTDPNMVDDAYFEIGDPVEITVDTTDGLKAINYKYLFETEDSEEEIEETTDEIEVPENE